MSWRSDIQSVSRRAAIRCFALVILFTASTRFEPLASTVLDPDLWWHLRAGAAVFAQRTVPSHAVFTQHVERPWIEYSWGFEVLSARVYAWFGLMGLVALRSLVEVVITATVFLLLRRGLRSFWQAWLLAAAGMWAMHHCLGLQPMLASIAMFACELTLIFEARRRQAARPLWALPILFLFWANLHIQFIYGILVLLLLSGPAIVQAVLPAAWARQLRTRRDLPTTQVLAVTGLSILATFIGPYSWHLYSVLWDYVRSSVPYTIIIELQSLNFHAPEHYVFVLILAAGFFALGWRRSRDPFPVALIAICALIAFRMTRDSWVGCLPALAIIAERETVTPEESRKPFAVFAFAASTLVATTVLFTLIAWDSKTNNASLERVVAARFPVNASAFVRDHSLPGPIYNDMNWGGFLIWALPEQPVAIDNRTDLYGDELLSRFYLVQQGFSDWRADPDLNAARVVLLSRRTPLAQRLVRDDRFQLVYEDGLAVVFTRNESSSTLSGSYNRPSS